MLCDARFVLVSLSLVSAAGLPASADQAGPIVPETENERMDMPAIEPEAKPGSLAAAPAPIDLTSEAFTDFDTSLALKPPAARIEPVEAVEPDPVAIKPLEPIAFEIGFAPLLEPEPGAVDDGPTDFEPISAGGGDGALAFRFNRETALYDAGYGEATTEEGSFAGSNADGERFSRYSLDIEWNPAGEDAAVQWLVVGGLHAIKADIGRLDDASLDITEAQGTVAIPTVGTGMRWAPARDLTFSTIARTQSVDSSASMLNLLFSADLELSPGVGLSAGYEFYESDLSVDNVRTQIDREGYFAKLTIRF